MRLEKLPLKEHGTGIRQEHSGDSGALREHIVLRLQSGGWVTLLIIREGAKEGWAGKAGNKPPFFTPSDEFTNSHMNCQWWYQLVLNKAG